jgi:hypothetical protein
MKNNCEHYMYFSPRPVGQNKVLFATKNRSRIFNPSPVKEKKT